MLELRASTSTPLTSTPPVGPGAATSGPAQPNGWRQRFRGVALTVWLAATVWSFATWLPIDWPGLSLAGMLTALLFRRERGIESAFVAIRDWFGLACFFLAYGLSRAAADTLGMPIQERSMIVIDRVLGFGELPNHRIQRLIDWDADPKWWEALFSLNYGSHFIVTFAVLGTLYVTNRPRWSRYMRRWLLLSCLGLVGYILMPTVPPWMSSESGNIAMVYEGLPRGWSTVNIPVIEDMFRFGRDNSNQIAAMPSLHAAYPALLFLFFAPDRGRLGKTLLAGYVLFMGWTIVITGQHWVIDMFAGWLVAWVAHRLIGMTESASATSPS